MLRRPPRSTRTDTRLPYTTLFLSWIAVLVIGLATAAHQAFSANLYTLPSDIFPRGAVGSVVGIGGTVGAVGGMGMAWFTGYILDATHSYATLFAICAGAYFVALAAVQLLSPRLARVDGIDRKSTRLNSSH